MNASRLKQVRIYIGKHFRVFMNEKGWFIFVFAAIIAFAVSYVQNPQMFVFNLATRSGFLTLCFACTYIGIFNSIQTICKEREIIKREHRAGLHMSAYVISHVIWQGIVCLIEAVIFLGISAIFLHYPPYSLLPGPSLLCYFITYFLIIFAADMLALMVSAVVKTPNAAMTFMPFLLILEMIFSGALFPLNPPTDKIAGLTVCNYGMKAACISADYNHLKDTEKEKFSVILEDELKEEGWPVEKKDIDTILDEHYEAAINPAYEYTTANLVRQWLFMVLHSAVCAGIAIVSLEFIDRDRR